MMYFSTMSLIRITERKLAANRANALKSTRPRTPAGKARSAQNGRKHGLFSKALIAELESPEIVAECARRVSHIQDPLERNLTFEWWLLQPKLTYVEQFHAAALDAALAVTGPHLGRAFLWMTRHTSWWNAYTRAASPLHTAFNRILAALTRLWQSRKKAISSSISVNQRSSAAVTSARSSAAITLALSSAAIPPAPSFILVHSPNPYPTENAHPPKVAAAAAASRMEVPC